MEGRKKKMKDVYVTIDDEIIKKVEAITMTDYDATSMVSVDKLVDILTDMIVEYDRLEEEKEALENDLENNYQKIEKNEQYEIYNHDFI